MSFRKCPDCREVKNPSEYYLNKKASHGLSTYCKKCISARSTAHRNRKKEKALNYLGNKCAECGTSRDLEFDHIDPSKKSFCIADRLTTNSERLIKELDKCQLLCRDCHKLKTFNRAQKGPAHGTMDRVMLNKCSCRSCRLAIVAYLQGYKDGESNYSRVAQLVERLAVNEDVAGS